MWKGSYTVIPKKEEDPVYKTQLWIWDIVSDLFEEETMDFQMLRSQFQFLFNLDKHNSNIYRFVQYHD